ncbi:hypothetical protein [Mycobacterium haemophilum]
MTHMGCVYDDPDAALAFGQVRGHRLVLASLYDDDEDGRAVLEEIGDCAECLRCLVLFLAAMAGSIGVRLAEMAGQDRDAAVQQFEKQLGEALDELRHL